ncbi:metal-dependent hydrolase [Alteromonas genovensis]|uniref:metal-dependent hydrolase n=1 Tax=Alteromonas genovensis TaxID=471225 RepID=UPI002FE15CC4
MDSLTQAALGGAVGYAVLGNKVGRKAALWGAILGTLPDLDVFLPYEGAVEAFTYHRGFSHSLLVHLLISPLIVWLLTHIHKDTSRFKYRWFWLVFLCLSTHAVLDSFTVYGTQLLWPITEYPFAISNIFIIDPFVTIPLLVGLIMVLLPKVQGITKARANAFGLLVSCIYLGWSLIGKGIIDNIVESALAKQGIQSQHYMSTPAPLTTLLWRSVVVVENEYYEIYTSVFDAVEDVSVDAYPTSPKLLIPVKSEWGIKRLQWFTKGLYSVRLQDDDIILSDLRMGVECAYAFNFKVAKQTDSGVEVGSFEKFSERPELSDIQSIWQRIWDPSISLAPTIDQQPPC